jgi:hypothetical protein
MKNRYFISVYLAGMLLFFFASCSRNTSSPPTRYEPRLSYVLSIPSVDTVHVLAEFSPLDDNGVAKILFPPFNADNPVVTFNGNNIHNLKLTNAAIADSLRAGLWLGDSVQSVLVNTTGLSFAIEYDITFPYSPNTSPGYKTILPGRYGQADGYFQGNYIFCVPAFGADQSAWWRRSLDAQVSLGRPVAGSVHGIPLQPFTCGTVYELFFTQFAITDNVLSCGGTSSSGIVVLSSHQPPAEAGSLICADLAKADSICAKHFPPLLVPRAVILQDSGSGMEGLFSFYMANWSYAELFHTFRPVIAHEALHAWIGIRTGDLDDPWWKEGTASYLGRVLGANIGFPKDSLRPQLVKDLSANPMVNGKAMSDPYVRHYLYDRDSNVNCLVLVYDKGAQACMILDKMIRQATGNASTLFSKTGDLCTRYDHSAFSRSQFKALLEENTTLDLSGFFDTYIDRAGAIDTAVLSGAWHFLDSCGAFSTKP